MRPGSFPSLSHEKWIGALIPGKTVKVPGGLSDKNGVKNQDHLRYGQEYEYKSDV